MRPGILSRLTSSVDCRNQDASQPQGHDYEATRCLRDSREAAVPACEAGHLSPHQLPDRQIVTLGEE
ncbi:hypothetical protein CTA1_7240 [Colletotrichum tanaceti]|uniref:Uncharacterized protein n=1 Tax=Colletotrichum tanaceti TaxID=1306861 RepID=A0A4U6X4J2_9PEZI|nr:hypothetical protein CTA1_7240 [Colletotrichum tanaceti]